MQETLLVDFVEQARLTVPRRYRSQIFSALFLGSDIAHLDDDERVLSRGTGCEQDVGVQLARGALDAVAEVFDERGRCCTSESAVNR